MNTQDNDQRTDMEPYEILDILNEHGYGRSVESFIKLYGNLESDATFADTYGDPFFGNKWAVGPPEPAFIYRHTLYTRHINGSWEGHNGEEIIEWLVDNPPFRPLDTIADLYAHDKYIDSESSPWLLFQYIVGIAETTQSWQLTKLIPVGVNDAVKLGNALKAWGGERGYVHSYVELLLEYQQLATG